MSESTKTEYKLPFWTKSHSRLAIFLLLGLIVLLRIVWLGSDAYLRLDWSAALLTDEGFYAHNARNAVLFGNARTDEFNNMLLSPLLHMVQWGVFSIFGPGMVQTRAISVVCSLLTLWVLFAAMRRAFDNRIAWTTVTILGLDHSNLLYNRLGLMDTPATLPLVGAFYAFLRATQSESHRSRWFCFCGTLLCVAVISRNLCLYILPVPFVAWWFNENFKETKTNPRRSRDLQILLSTMVVCVAVYGLVWYLPNRAEIAPMNRYYRVNQVQPHSLVHLLQNVQHAFIGDFRGVAPYLFRHTPIVFVFAILGIVGLFRKQTLRDSSEIFLASWLVLGWLVLATISYSPSRYYVSTYPAMAGLASIQFLRFYDRLKSGDISSKLSIPGYILIGFCGFHAALATVHYEGVLPKFWTKILLYGTPIILVVLMTKALSLYGRFLPLHYLKIVSAIWLVFNLAWLGNWATHLEWSQINASHRLAKELPVGSILIGDVSPGITMETPFKAIHVQPGLANDHNTIEKYKDGPQYIAILDGIWREKWWLKFHPDLITDENRVMSLRILKWDVGIYKVK